MTHITAIRVAPSLFRSKDFWEHRENEDFFELKPNGFVLAQTMEKVTIPNDLMGFVEGRSSWARTGLSVHLTAPKIDPGFSGNITLEIANMGNQLVRLTAEEDKPAQLILMNISTPLSEEDLYGSDKDGDIFQLQSDPIPRNK